jgi:ABC-type sugar transport system permease subunit
MSTSAASLQAKPRQRSLLARVWRCRLEYLFILPFYLIFGLFSLYPLGWALYLSFNQWSGFGDMRWVGLDNYRAILSEETTHRALLNSVIFTVVLVPISVFTSLVLATLLNIRSLRGRGVYRTIYFLPFLTSTVIVGIVFQMLFDDSFGWLNGGLRLLGLPALGWLSEPAWAKAAVMILTLWQSLGYSTLIMLGGLQSLPRELYEAAEIDGAGAWSKFTRITVPLMRPVMLFVAITKTIGVLNLFEQPYILTRGGPQYATTTMTYRLYELAFQTTRFGDGAALGYLIAAIVITISLINLRVLRSWRDAS